MKRPTARTLTTRTLTTRTLTTRTLTAIACLSMFGLAQAPSAAVAADATTPVIRVMPLGDSITNGYGSSTGAGYRLPLANLAAGQSKYRVDFVGSLRTGQMGDPDNEGHGGWMINDIAAHVNDWLTTYKPDVVLLHIGINDLDRGTDKEHAADRLKALVDQIFAARPGMSVVLSGLIPNTSGLQDLITPYNTKARALEAQEQQAGKKLRYVATPALTGTEMHDTLHPADPGYVKLAQTFDAGLDRAYADGWVTGRVPAAGAPETRSKVRWADFDGDGKADYTVVNDNGSVNVYLNKGGDGHGGWTDYGQVASGLTTDRSKVRFADIDGDGKADYVVINADGSVHAYLNNGGDGHGGWSDYGQIASGMTTDANQVRFADVNGDGKADYVVTNANGSVRAFVNNGGDGHGGWTDYGQIAAGMTSNAAQTRFGDIDGDGKADYLLINPNGSVHAFLNKGGDGHGGWTDYGQIASGLSSNADQVRFTDINGDGKADYVLVNADGSVRVFLNKGGDGHGGWTDDGRIASGVVTE